MRFIRQTDDRFFFNLIVILFNLFFYIPSFAGINSMGDFPAEYMYLSETPPVDHSRGHKGGHKAEHRVGEGEHSEHRATPLKKFYLNIHDMSDSAQAYVLQPDGSMSEGKLDHKDGAWSLTFSTKPMDGTMDGVFNVYVVDKQVIDGILVVRVAKMSAINHSCGWGHKYKYDKDRLNPKALNLMPLEIVGHGLWDKNFHVKTMSGDTLSFNLLSYGRPVNDATVIIRTQSGWEKRLKAGDKGNIQVQLIRDYYPERWSSFNRSNRGSFILTVIHEWDEKGEFSGKGYSRVRVESTFPWRYQPQRREYTSYAYGLSVMTLFALFLGAGVYIYRKRRKIPHREVMFDE